PQVSKKGAGAPPPWAFPERQASWATTTSRSHTRASNRRRCRTGARRAAKRGHGHQAGRQEGPAEADSPSGRCVAARRPRAADAARGVSSQVPPREGLCHRRTGSWHLDIWAGPEAGAVAIADRNASTSRLYVLAPLSAAITPGTLSMRKVDCALPNTAITGATYGIEGGRKLVAGADHRMKESDHAF